MKNYQCSCGNRLFFENTTCLRCGLDTGFCPACRTVASLKRSLDGGLYCGNASCRTALKKCDNYAQYGVCNWCVRAPATDDGAATSPQASLCDCCRFNHTIPDLSVAGNQQKWGRLEAAKRRLFYDLDLLRLPYGTAGDQIAVPLSFDFKGDVIAANNRLHALDHTEKVYTGHEAGTITINIIEADDVEREKTRVALGEPQRTLLGHFRHEIGHYYWDLLVKNHCEAECAAVFGDHTSPSYAEALKSYYEGGPPANWADSYISAYASMHPWEDFAETWLTYLTLISEFDTAMNVGFLGPEVRKKSSLEDIVAECQKLSVALNEMNRCIGLVDAMPKPIVSPVVGKLQFIHDLIMRHRQDAGNDRELSHAENAAGLSQPH